MRGNMDVKAVAHWFLSNESMCNLKLNILCYYAQAFYLAIYGIPLVNSSFEARNRGPVSPQLYEFYKNCGWFNIRRYTKRLHIDKQTEQLLIYVYYVYGDLTARRLRELSTNEMPWLKVYDDYSKVISEEDMQVYYSEKIKRIQSL